MAFIAFFLPCPHAGCLALQHAILLIDCLARTILFTTDSQHRITQDIARDSLLPLCMSVNWQSLPAEFLPSFGSLALLPLLLCAFADSMELLSWCFVYLLIDWSLILLYRLVACLSFPSLLCHLTTSLHWPWNLITHQHCRFMQSCSSVDCLSFLLLLCCLLFQTCKWECGKCSDLAPTYLYSSSHTCILKMFFPFFFIRMFSLNTLKGWASLDLIFPIFLNFLSQNFYISCKTWGDWQQE